MSVVVVVLVCGKLATVLWPDEIPLSVSGS